MNIYIIRHAQTTMNAKGKVFSGATNVSLSQTGIEVTKELSKNQLWTNIDHAFITPLVRTRETADILFPSYIPRTVIQEFAEMDFGDYEGRVMTPDNQNDPIFNKWLNAPEKLTFPNGDNLMFHAKDAYNALLNIAIQAKYENIAIVSHATTIRLMLSLLITGKVNHFRKIPCDNSCVSLIESENSELRIKYINAPLL